MIRIIMQLFLTTLLGAGNPTHKHTIEIKWQRLMNFERNFWNGNEENETFANHSRTHARMQALSDYSLV